MCSWDETCLSRLFIASLRLFRDASLSIMIMVLIMSLLMFPPSSLSEVVLFASLFVPVNGVNGLILYMERKRIYP